MGATSSVKGGQPRASTTASKASCRFLDPAVLHSPVKPTAVYPSIPASVTSEKRASFSVSFIPPDSRAQTQSPTSLIHLRKQADETFAIATAAENSGHFKKACDAYELAADFFRLAETAATALPGNTDVKALKDAQAFCIEKVLKIVKESKKNNPSPPPRPQSIEGLPPRTIGTGDSSAESADDSSIIIHYAAPAQHVISQDIPQDMTDQYFTMELMSDPVIAVDGFTYERSSIERWFASGKKTSPKSGAELSSLNLIPNHDLRNRIQEWQAGR